jgi:putative ABC transport system permease protein
MLRSFITTAYRSLVRNKVTSLINLSGLMLGLTTGIIIMLFVLFDLRINHTHQHLQSIHSVMLNMDLGGNISTGRATPGPFGPVLKQQVPSVKYMTRMSMGQSLLQVGDKTLYQSSIYADPDMFRMFTFPALAGDPVTALEDINSVVITREAALRIFNTEDALGKTILVDNKHPLKVGAVVENIPSSSSVSFDLVMPMALFAKDNDWMNKRWDNDQFLTWIQLMPGSNLEEVNKQMTRLLQQNTETKESAFAYPLNKSYLFNNFKNGKPNGGRIYMVSILLVLGIFVLLIACINFMNLATAMAEGRMREVGVRKVLGCC